MEFVFHCVVSAFILIIELNCIYTFATKDQDLTYLCPISCTSDKSWIYPSHFVPLYRPTCIRSRQIMIIVIVFSYKLIIGVREGLDTNKCHVYFNLFEPLVCARV